MWPFFLTSSFTALPRAQLAPGKLGVGTGPLAFGPLHLLFSPPGCSVPRPSCGWLPGIIKVITQLTCHLESCPHLPSLFWGFINLHNQLSVFEIILFIYIVILQVLNKYLHLLNEQCLFFIMLSEIPLYTIHSFNTYLLTVSMCQTLLQVLGKWQQTAYKFILSQCTC